jgi:hypothetical protein
MFKQLTMAFLINLYFLSPAHAENWVFLGSTEGDNRPFYLDTDSIQGSNGYYQYWMQKPATMAGYSLLSYEKYNLRN